MGLFSLLKNGFTIEKKKKPQEATTEEPDTELDDNAETEVEEVPTIEEPAVIEPTPAEKRLAAEYILYGDTNPAAIAATTPQTPAQPETPVATTTAAPVQQTYQPYTNVTTNFNNALLGQVSANQNLLVISPKSPNEISAILSNLASGNACIVSLANIADPQRHLDYICGFINAIGGTIMQRTQTEYILTPKGVGIKS